MDKPMHNRKVNEPDDIGVLRKTDDLRNTRISENEWTQDDTIVCPGAVIVHQRPWPPSQVKAYGKSLMKQNNSGA